MFSLSTAALLYWGSLISATLASPLVTRATLPCNPDFPVGKRISIGNSQFIGLSDGPKIGSGLIKATTAPFLFSQTIDSSGSTLYTISSFDDPLLLVGQRANGSLFLQPEENRALQFQISCSASCGTGLVGDGCFIQLASNPEFCVQNGDRNGSAGARGDPLNIRQCVKNDGQRFNFFVDEPIPTTSASVTTQSISITHSWHDSTPTSSTPTRAAPSPSASVCHPNFEFAGVTVANSAVSWGAPQFEAGVELIANGNFNQRMEVRFEQTGSPSPSYVAKSLNGSGLAISIRPDTGRLFLTKQNASDPYQQFEIDCIGGCPGGNIGGGGLAADNCKIWSALTDRCVQIGTAETAGRSGDPIFTNACANIDSQRFNFPTSPFAPIGRGAGQNGDKTFSVSGAVSDSDGESNLNTLIRNSYIIIGLLGVVLVMMLMVTLTGLTKGLFKGKPKYKGLPKHDY